MQLRHAHHQIKHDGKGHDIAGVIEIIHLMRVRPFESYLTRLYCTAK
jgi:hypothetical protein